MRSQRIEFYRFGKLDVGMLRARDRYLVSHDGQPVCEYEMPLDQDEFLDMMRALGYRSSPSMREAAQVRLATIVTDMLKSSTLPSGNQPLQLDLVVNAAELGALQFEAALSADGQPLLARDDSIVTLTRRVRGAGRESSRRWPSLPRVLFAWASPLEAGEEVPHAEHCEALRGALAPWIGPLAAQADDVLKVLERTTLQQLAKELARARAEGRPYSHLHILAHGYPVGSNHRQRFGLALHDVDGELAVVEADQLVEALSPLRDAAATVTLAACDSANDANTLIADRSIAHQLHVSGIAVVLASQLPLTVAGSTVLASTLYRSLLAGEDVRIATHQARVALRKRQDTTYHDWMSLVCYASLPEAYAETLHELRLERTLAALQTAQAWSDDLITRGSADAGEFQRIEQRLTDAIADLERYLASSRSSPRRETLDEHLGLLGSAEKRLAELQFRRGKLCPADSVAALSRAAMTRAMSWYFRAARSNLSQHWQAVQTLSLEAALTGRIGRPGLWHAAVEAALLAREDAGEYWASGSLVELYLLAPLAGQRDMMSEAIFERDEMIRRLCSLPAENADRAFASESMRRQMQRYIAWWTHEHGFFPGRADLGSDARRLLEQAR
jgi:hypothetical protein